MKIGDAEVDHLRHRHSVVQGHQDVRRFDVPVDDPFLVGVLDGVADLNEQVEPPADRVGRASGGEVALAKAIR